MTGRPPWASAVSIWRESRRRQGEIEQIDEGTRLEYVFDGLERRGWDPYREGEDSDTEEAGLGAAPAGDDLADELFSHDKRAMGLERYRVVGFGSAFLDAIDDGLARHGFVCVIGTGTRTPFYSLPDDREIVVDDRHLGGDNNGHAMRVFARIMRNGRRLYGLQNSWSLRWGKIWLPDGTSHNGCCWADESVIASVWDAYFAEVKT